MVLLFKEYPISINDKKDIEFLLEKEPFSDKTKNSIDISTTFFHNKTKVDFYDKQIWIRSKITPNFALIIPFASLLITIYLISKSSNFYWVENIGILFGSAFTSYLLLVHLTESTHTKIQNHIFMNLYNHSFKKHIENERT